MFRCQSCNTVVPPRTRSQKIVVQTRQRIYEPRGVDPSERRGGRGRGRSTRKKQAYDKGGQGTEIVRELMVCPNCAEKMTAEAEAKAAETAASPVTTE
ncbi:MAG: hypothetical protein Tsb009_37710 [Planctomycetaceae bacterium]